MNAILNILQGMPGNLKAVEHEAVIKSLSETLHHETISEL
jgi:hypothetical protein